MKSNKLLRCALGLMGMLGGYQVANAAYTFAFSVPGPDGIIHREDPLPAWHDKLGASGEVIFDGTTVKLFIENGDLVSSAISKVYLLKPMGIDATDVDGPAGWDVYNSLDDPNKDGKPGTIMNNELGPGGTNVYEWDVASYFGTATSDAGTRIDNGDSALFTFTMASTTNAVNWADYGDPAHPTIVVRWQEVDGGGSSAGYGWLTDGGVVPPVPEPRLIAPLAALGLGGLLMVRRRITRKAKKA
jgi:MYXO-CTERM domain-containing protein